MLRLKLIACKALYREISLITATSPSNIDVTFLKQGLHDTPEVLRRELQAQIDAIDSGEDMFSSSPRFGQDFDAVLLGYGLCSNAIIGLRSKKYQLVIPHCDDCIALFLGSYKRYLDYFGKNPGTYWWSAGWIENGYVPSGQNRAALLEEYTCKFGSENAEYIMQTSHGLAHYDRFAYVDWERLKFPEYEKLARDSAAEFGFNFDKLKGEETFLADFLSGNWDERFLIVPPGKKVVANYEGMAIDYE